MMKVKKLTLADETPEDLEDNEPVFDAKGALLAAIISLLPTRKEYGMSILEIVDELEYLYSIKVTRGTVSSALDKLWRFTHEYTVPLGRLEASFTNKGDRTGYYLIPRSGAKGLTEGELALVINMVSGDRSIDSETQSSIIGKLGGARLGRMDDRPSTRRERHFTVDVTENVRMLRSAMARERKVELMTYEYGIDLELHPTSDKPIIFSPYHITHSSGKPYVIGIREGESCLSSYRIDKIGGIMATRSGAVSSSEEDKEISRIQLTDDYVGTAPVGTNVKEYVARHPYMLGGNAVSLELRVLRDALGDVIDAFGLSIETGADESDEYIRVSLNASADDAYRFCLAHSDRVELVAGKGSEHIRRRLRRSAAAMSDTYLKTPEDKYYAEVDRCSESGWLTRGQRRFSIPHFDLSTHTEHHDLDLRCLTLRDNRVTDLSFIKNYKELASFRCSEEEIEDLSPLAACEELQEIELRFMSIRSLDFIKEMRSLRKLVLDHVTVDDPSALYTCHGLDYVVIYGSNGGIDPERIREASPVTVVAVDPDRSFKARINPIYPINKRYQLAYPLNLIHEIFRVDEKDIYDIGEEGMRAADAEALGSTEIISAIDAALAALPELQSRVVSKMMREHLSAREAALALGIRTGEAIGAFEAARSALHGTRGRRSETERLATAPYSRRVINRSLSDAKRENRGKAEIRARLIRAIYLSDDASSPFDSES